MALATWTTTGVSAVPGNSALIIDNNGCVVSGQ